MLLWEIRGRQVSLEIADTLHLKDGSGWYFEERKIWECL